MARRCPAGHLRAARHRRCHCVIKLRTAVSGAQGGNRFFNFIAVRAEWQQRVDGIVVANYGGFPRGADHGLREDNRGFLNGGQERGDVRTGFKNEHRGNLLSAHIEGVDDLVGAVVQNVEVQFLEVDNRFALGADDHHRHAHQRDADFNRALGRLLLFGRARLCRAAERRMSLLSARGGKDHGGTECSQKNRKCSFPYHGNTSLHRCKPKRAFALARSAGSGYMDGTQEDGCYGVCAWRLRKMSNCNHWWWRIHEPQAASKGN